jgi:hypothetical protein
MTAVSTRLNSEAIEFLLLRDGVPVDVVAELRWCDIDWSGFAVRVPRPCAHRCLIGLAVGLVDRPSHRHIHVSRESITSLARLRERQMLGHVRDGHPFYATDRIATGFQAP